MGTLRIPRTKANDGAKLIGLLTGTGMQVLAKVKSINVPAVTDGESSNAVIFTDADYIGFDALIITPTSLPPDEMTQPVAWISNPNTGEAIARFAAVGGNMPNESQDFLCIGLKLDD